MIFKYIIAIYTEAPIHLFGSDFSMQGKCVNCQGTGNVTFNLGIIGHHEVRCAVCHGTGYFNITTHNHLGISAISNTSKS